MRKLPSPTIGGALREQAGDWADPASSDPADDVTPSKEPRTADVYFCGHTTFFPLNRALQAISKEKLTGLLRSFWEQEPIDLLARDGEIIFRLYPGSGALLPGDASASCRPRCGEVLRGRAINREKLEPHSFSLLPARNR